MDFLKNYCKQLNSLAGLTQQAVKHICQRNIRDQIIIGLNLKMQQENITEETTKGRESNGVFIGKFV